MYRKMKMGGVGYFQIGGMIVGLVVVIAMSMSMSVATEVHHVVGGDRGWDPTSDIVSWSSGRVFRVGDQIWFAYSVAQGLVAELKSREEYESCDVSNPIMMYTDGLHTIPLEREGIRYFVSSDSENCKKGLKLHVEVLPKSAPSPFTPTVQAAGPTVPSGSAGYGQSPILALMLMLFCLTVGFAY